MPAALKIRPLNRGWGRGGIERLEPSSRRQGWGVGMGQEVILVLPGAVPAALRLGPVLAVPVGESTLR